MIRHKQYIDGVVRIRGESESRKGKLRLDKNERTTQLPDEFLLRLRQTVDSELVCAYPETEALYDVLAEHHGVGRDCLVLTAGSDGAIRHCFDVCVSPGDDVVVLDPTFAMVGIYCQLFGAKRIAAGYDANLRLDLDRLLDAIGPRSSLIVVANPNSPTGTLISELEMEAIISRAARFEVAVLVDEAYFGFCNQTALPWVAHFPNLAVSRTFSKATGLAGLRVGYVVAQSELAQLLYRFRPMYEVNAVGVAAARLVMQSPGITERYLAETEKGRAMLKRALSSRGIAYRDTHTNFIHIDFGARKQAALAEFAREDILVRGGLPVPGFESYLRISLGPEEAMARVVRVVDHVAGEQRNRGC